MSRKIHGACLALALCAPASAQSRESIGAYYLVPNVDAMTDVDETFIYTPALDPSPLRSPQLAWLCYDSDYISLAVVVDDFLTIDARTTVQWRVDDQPAYPEVPWPVLNTGTSVLAPQRTMARFAVAAMRGRSVLVRVTDYRGVSFDLRFSLAGLTAALRSLPCFGALEASIAEADRADRENEARVTELREERAAAERAEAARRARSDSIRAAEAARERRALLRNVVTRSVPAEYGDSTGIIYRGERAILHRCLDGWCEVEYLSSRGWVADSLLAPGPGGTP